MRLLVGSSAFMGSKGIISDVFAQRLTGSAVSTIVTI